MGRQHWRQWHLVFGVSYGKSKLKASIVHLIGLISVGWTGTEQWLYEPTLVLYAKCGANAGCDSDRNCLQLCGLLSGSAERFREGWAFFVVTVCRVFRFWSWYVSMSVTTKEPELQTLTVIRSHGCEHGSRLYRCNGVSCRPLAKVVKSRAAV